MPLFDFECLKCHHNFEFLDMGLEKPACPKCQATKLEKKLSVFASPSGGSSPSPSPGSCGTCGDPRGPGSCKSN
ncbi:MAG: FmdB family zinc ribbon protein [Planctomycetota bacterium]